MVDIIGVAHFSIPVSDPERSIRFYRDVVGCKVLRTQPDNNMTFLDAGGVCVLLIKTPFAEHPDLQRRAPRIHGSQRRIPGWSVASPLQRREDRVGGGPSGRDDQRSTRLFL